MNYKILLYSWIILVATISNGQTTIECDLIELTKLTIDKSPLIQRNELQIQNAEGSFLIQRSAFDYQLTAGFSLSKNKSNLFDVDARNTLLDDRFIETNSSDFSLGLQRRFRIGLLASINLNYDVLSDNFPINQFNQEVGSFISDHTVSTTFSLTQPLIRGRGSRVTTALEKASKLQIESNKSNYELTTSFELLQMAAAYWQYVGAYKNHVIFKENEERVRNVLRITEELVKLARTEFSTLEKVVYAEACTKKIYSIQDRRFN